ncbi:MAG: hypothetical protein AB1425_02925 [Actinomycetota bacterium]
MALLLLLHRLYNLPDDVSRFALHPDGGGLIRVVHLQQALDLPYVAQRPSHELKGILLLLLLLLLLTTLLLLLVAFRHEVSLSVGRYDALGSYLPWKRLG